MIALFSRLKIVLPLIVHIYQEILFVQEVTATVWLF